MSNPFSDFPELWEMIEEITGYETYNKDEIDVWRSRYESEIKMNAEIVQRLREKIVVESMRVKMKSHLAQVILQVLVEILDNGTLIDIKRIREGVKIE